MTSINWCMAFHVSTGDLRIGAQVNSKDRNKGAGGGSFVVCRLLGSLSDRGSGRDMEEKG